LALFYYILIKNEDENLDSEIQKTEPWKEYEPNLWNTYKDYYEEYLESDVWEEKRTAAMERARGKCESDGCSNPATEVHHVTYPEDLGREPISFLQALCRPCHSEEHPEKTKGYMTAEEASKALKKL
jgi:5-methylcytosine-specific restriction endonuclease McrA